LEWEDAGPERAALLGGTDTGNIIVPDIFSCISNALTKYAYTFFPGGGGTTHMDDEYRWVGVEDPKIMITTSHDPSSRLKMFVKVTKTL
jgi:U3 small nucleolar ribonucleoprotein protein IMP4